ncbi:hypothetical protein ASF36_16575 [Methylobacterium sp. Leaf90]|nr:hypothetical protein ASF36_16575 [Methylobacterium sp. Leaf90]
MAPGRTSGSIPCGQITQLMAAIDGCDRPATLGKPVSDDVRVPHKTARSQVVLAPAMISAAGVL